ncbi:MAG: ZIP family metal transporter [Deltaproteobacteria bacterium]|nr:ZIP family metal transporter [Deltaproteobacteria bacterium]
MGIAATTFALNLFTALAMIAAGYAVALRPRSGMTQTRLKNLMAVGSGFLITLVFFELLPASLHTPGISAYSVFSTVFFGIAVVFVFDRWFAPMLTFWDKPHEDDGCAHHHDYHHDHGHDHAAVTGPTPDHPHAACGHAILGHGAACSAVGCLIVCSFFDGIAFSGGLVRDVSLGMLIFMGQILHVVPEGLLASSIVLAASGHRKSARRAALATGICFLLGALIPGLVTLIPASLSSAGQLGGIQNFFLPFSSGILLYVALAQLVPASNGSRTESFLVVSGGAGFGLLHLLINHTH